MKYLVINTAHQPEALLLAGEDSYHFSLPEKTLASTHLMTNIDEMLDSAGLAVGDLDAFACVIGPGSFTGIRIGVSVVRALSYALKKPILPIIYFDVLAYNTKTPFSAVADAGCGLCYLKNYDSDGDKPPVVARLEDIPQLARKNIVTDMPSLAANPKLSGMTVKLAEGGMMPLKAAAQKAIEGGDFVDFDKLEPLYMRKSQPEREAGDL